MICKMESLNGLWKLGLELYMECRIIYGSLNGNGNGWMINGYVLIMEWLLELVHEL